MKLILLPLILTFSTILTAQGVSYLSPVPQTVSQTPTVQNNPVYNGTQLFSATTIGSTFFNPNNLGFPNCAWGDDIEIPSASVNNASSANISQVRLGLYRGANAPATQINIFYGSMNSTGTFSAIQRLAVFDLPANGASNILEILTVGDNSKTIFNVALSDYLSTYYPNYKTFSLGMSISGSGANGWMLQNGGSKANLNAFVRSDTVSGITDFVTFNPFANPPNACFYSEVFGSAAVPITLRDFSALIVSDAKKNSKLIWETVSEHQNAGFEIQKSNDGVSFSKIGFVKGKGETGGEYSFTDAEFDQKAYYRLKQMDNDGSFSYSKVVALATEKNGKTKLEVFPNPSHDGHFSVKSGEIPEGLQVINVQGQVIQQEKTPLSTNSPIDLSSQPQGIYWLKSADGQTTKVIKN